MPRKFWKQKNRYCWNSNLSEEVFLCLLRLYCTGYNCSQATRIIGRYARRYSRKRISRQTANRYYLLFGDYLYEMLPDWLKVENIDLEPFGEKEFGTALDAQDPKSKNAVVILTALHRALYNKLAWNDPINQIAVGVSVQAIYELLTVFSRSKRGYPLETFCCHYAYCIWCILIMDARQGEPVWKTLFNYLRDSMKTRPIGTFHLNSIRIVQT